MSELQMVQQMCQPTTLVSGCRTHHRLLDLVIDGNHAGTGCTVGERRGGGRVTHKTSRSHIPSNSDQPQHVCIQQSNKSGSGGKPTRRRAHFLLTQEVTLTTEVTGF